MEKKLKRIIAVLLCLAAALAFAGCMDNTPEPTVPEVSSTPTTPAAPEYIPENALDLWERINDTMDALSSMEMTICATNIYYAGGYMYEQVTESYVLSTQQVHYTESESRLSCAALDLSQTITMVEAFYDGKMYRGINDGVYDQKFCSEMSHEDYDGLQTGGLTQELSIADCTTSRFSKTAEGGWSLSFSGYTKKAIDQALSTLGLTEGDMGASVSDMQVNLNANENFQVTDMQVFFDFAQGGQTAPVFTISTRYSGWNTVGFDADRLKAEEYVQVEDVYLLDAVSAAITKRQEASIGQFTLETKTTEIFQNQTRSAEEKGVIIYGLENNAYSYFFSANTEGKSFVVRYQNGQQTVISGGQSYTAATPEAEAKAYINGLINTANYRPITITGMQKQEDGCYVLTSNRPDISNYVEGINVISASQRIAVTFKNGELAEMESCLIIEGTYDDDTVRLQTESRVVFAENPEFLAE